jgi:CBS domain containing-hemolysin-like protein
MNDRDSQSPPPGRPRPLPFLARVIDLLLGRSANGSPALDALLESYLEDAHPLSEGERKMLVNLLSFGELRVDDVMVPRADIVAVEIGTPLPELAAIFRDAQHSRLPIYRETLDDPVGMVHIKDVLALLVPAAGEPQAGENVLQRLRRDTLFVPPSMRVMDLLIKMQKSHIHMALVIDEYGGTDGLVTIEDLIEEIVGEIEDEHDVEETALIAARPDGGFDVNARIPIEDLEQVLGRSLALPDHEEEIDTLGGLVFTLVGRVPQRGELISHPGGFEFEILDADPRRVKKVRVHRLSAKAARAQAPGEEASPGASEKPRGQAGKDKRSA